MSRRSNLFTLLINLICETLYVVCISSVFPYPEFQSFQSYLKSITLNSLIDGGAIAFVISNRILAA